MAIITLWFQFFVLKKENNHLGFITDLLNQYGYIVLFAALALELIAFPTPGETLMTYCGFLSYQGKLNWGMSILIASLGIISGITVSYFIGFALGKPFFEKYGSRVHFGPEKIEKTSIWFQKYGNGLLVIAYFIPGIRHVTGYFTGISKVTYKKFALHAYIGAFVWSSTFITLGRILGDNWEKYHASIKKYLIILGIASAIILITVYLYKGYRSQIKVFIISTLEKSIKIFHSLGKIRMVMVGFSVALVASAIYTGALIQDFLANEFLQFNKIINLAVHFIFPPQSAGIMHIPAILSSYKVLVPVFLVILVLIIVKGKNKLLEIRFLFITSVSAEVSEEILRRMFHLLKPPSSVQTSLLTYSFPSEQSFLAIVVYGFATFIVFRHFRTRWIGAIVLIISVVICLASGISIIYLGLQYPSDILAGYVFGSFILLINIILLEIYRILPTVRPESNN
jgi:membrane protein DedA with SNARE-associated domain